MFDIPNCTLVNALFDSARIAKNGLMTREQNMFCFGLIIIPNVYTLAPSVQHHGNETTIVSPKAHEFIAGDKIRIIIENLGPREVIVTRVDNDKTFSIDKTEGANIFIYGKYIDDLLTIDYDALSMLNISATQELYKKIKALEEKTNELSSQNATLVSQLNTFDAKLQTLESKLSSTAIKQ